VGAQAFLLSGCRKARVMRRKCEVCGKEIEPFAEYWVREPDRFNDKGVAIERGRPMPFCSLGCIFGWAGGEIRRQKREGKGIINDKCRRL
jgi:hypothetical protein